MAKKWIQNSIKREKRVRNYLRRKYGKEAFNADGTLKKSYIIRAIAELKRKNRNPKGLVWALHLALRLRKFKK